MRSISDTVTRAVWGSVGGCSDMGILWHDWRTNTLRCSWLKEPRAKRGDWPRCGAKAKSTGHPCLARAMENGRCRYHGGLSTGPKTKEGKIRALSNLRQYRIK